MRRRVGRSRPQGRVAASARRWVFFLEPLLVGDGLLLDVFDVQRPAPFIVAVETVGRRFAAHDLAEQTGKLNGVVNTEIQAEPAQRIVDVRGVAGKEDAALAETRRHPLVDSINVAVKNRIVARFREEILQPLLHRVLVESLLFRFAWARREQQAPQTVAVVTADFEQRAPFLRVGEVIARALGVEGVERKRRGEDQKPLWMRKTFEVDAERFAHRRAAAVAADQVAAGNAAGARRRLDLGFDPVVELREIHDARRERHRGMGEAAKALDGHIGELVLLALHDEGVPGVILQDAEIELGDHFARGAIPDPEFGLDQTARDDVVDEAQAVEEFKRRRVRGRGARIVVDPLLGLEDLDRKALTRQRQRRDDADRAAAGNEDGTLGKHFP